MTTPAQFDLGDDETFYIIVSETTTVYETLDAAGDDLQDKFTDDPQSFIAKTEIKDGDNGDGISVELNQVSRGAMVAALTGADIETESENEADG
jgi:hypothetical protein